MPTFHAVEHRAQLAITGLQQLLAHRFGAGRDAVEADRQHGMVRHDFVQHAHMRHHVRRVLSYRASGESLAIDRQILEIDRMDDVAALAHAERLEGARLATPHDAVKILSDIAFGMRPSAYVPVRVSWRGPHHAR